VSFWKRSSLKSKPSSSSPKLEKFNELRPITKQTWAEIEQLNLKSDFRNSSLSFVRLNWGRITDKLAITIKTSLKFNFSLSFAFRIRALTSLCQWAEPWMKCWKGPKPIYDREIRDCYIRKSGTDIASTSSLGFVFSLPLALCSYLDVHKLTTMPFPHF